MTNYYVLLEENSQDLGLGNGTFHAPNNLAINAEFMTETDSHYQFHSENGDIKAVVRKDQCKFALPADVRSQLPGRFTCKKT